MPSLMRDINIIARCARLFRNDNLEKLGIKGTMDSILLQVCREPGISQEQIARNICIDKSSVARKAARLEADGFITRTPSERDRRTVMLYPTDKAREAAEEIRSVLRRWNAFVTEELSDEQTELLWDALEKMYTKARQYAAEREDYTE